MQTQINFENFSLNVDVISRLKAKGVLRVNFGIGSMGIEGDEELTSQLLKEARLSEDAFHKNVEEILMISYNILGNHKKTLILNLKETDDFIENKIELIEEKFLDDSIKAKFLLNSLYKTNILDKFDWEIITKYHQEGKQLEELPVAILRFRIKHPFSDSPPVEKTKTFVFETISEEIDDLISELENVRNQLMRVSGRVK